MKNLPTLILLLMQLAVLIGIANSITQPYCNKHKTETHKKIVTKTRLKVIKSNKFLINLFFKNKTEAEIYEDYEITNKTKVERVCCEGYKLTDLDLCEPQCVENGCPANSKCVEPEVCECVKGYFSVRSPQNEKHYCEPICEKPCSEYSVCVAPNKCACMKGYRVIESMKCQPYCASGCPHGGVCVAPNTCDCVEGFKSDQGSCLPICSKGDKCRNGQCVYTDECICNRGYTWDHETHMCTGNSQDGSLDTTYSSSTYYPDFESVTKTTNSVPKVETNTETSNNDIDPNQVFNENVESTTYNDLDNEDSTNRPSHHQCNKDYVFHQGECRPLKFASNEIDCRFKPCQDEHAVCLENGTCVCADGYKLFKIHLVDDSNQSIKGTCLTLADYEARLQKLEEGPQTTDANPVTNWTTICFVLLGVLVLFSALVFLGLKLVRTRRGNMDVEGKNMTCAYNNRACSEAEKSVI